MAPPSHLGNQAHLSASALGAHLNNIRGNLPPQIRSACLPDSVSAFLRNVLFASTVLNGFLFISSILAAGSRFMGLSVVLVSLASCTHLLFAGAVLGGHVADSVSTLGSMRLANTLRNGAARFGIDPYAHGALFGSTLALAAMLRVISSYYGGVARCVTNMASASVTNHNVTGGYKTFHDNMRGLSSSSFDPYGACGASGPVGFVSFLSGLLFWLDAALAVALHSKREEILSGVGGAGQMYDEIGVVPEDGSGGFAGDFPAAGGPRTMNV
ncbi:hypothetical protein ACHAXT_011408 [Thalassiosira profunda]